MELHAIKTPRTGKSESTPTCEFRWLVPQHTSTAPHRLQQKFYVLYEREHVAFGDLEIEWRDVPIVVGE